MHKGSLSPFLPTLISQLLSSATTIPLDAKASIQNFDTTRRNTNTMSPEQHAALITALRAIETKVDDAVKAAQGFEPRCIDTVNPEIASPTPTIITTASTTANEPLKIDNTMLESSPQPVELDGNPVSCPPKTNAIKSSDTTNQNTNAIVNDGKKSGNEERHHVARHRKRDYRDPPPGWKPPFEYGLMALLMPRSKDSVRRMTIKAPPTDRIDSIEKKLVITLETLDRHNSILRGVIYVGAFLLLALTTKAITNSGHEEWDLSSI